MSLSFDFSGRAAIVTGAGAGVGRAIAVALAGVARAARVSPSDVEREPIDQAVA